jgi:GT2 family glycosyltransferase
MDLSILLATWNNARRLAITLDSICQCEIPGNLAWELIVVNNNCSDDTDLILNEYAARLPLKLIHEPTQGLSRARNAGLAVSTGQLIIFTDDDIRPHNEWIKIYWQAFQEKPEGYFFGGPVESEYEGAPPDSELLQMAPWSVKGLDLGNTMRPLQGDEQFIAANWACPAGAVKDLGGFDENLGLNATPGKVTTGEETVLMGRLKQQGMIGLYLPAARIKHWVPVHKCSMQHIVARLEAAAYHRARSNPVPYSRLEIAGYPVVMILRGIKLYLKWLVRRATGRKGYAEWIACRLWAARLRGRRESAAARRG